MVAVLVTRPRAASEKLAGKLRLHGFDAVIEPLLSIEALPLAPPDIRAVQAVMITSASTFDVLGEIETAGLAKLPCFCVGPQTAEKAAAFGFHDVRNSNGDGAGLARLIGDMLVDKDRPILHIAAKDADSKARDGLVQMGYKVIAWPVYAATAASKLTDQTIHNLKQQKLDAIVVFSVRTAGVLKGLLLQNALEACCKSLSAIGLSEAVVEALQPLPWRRCIAATSPTEDAVIECLKGLYPLPA